jgi:hypothetical protein
MSKTLLDYVREGVKAKGKAELIRHLTGVRLTQREAIHALCYFCMGYYSDGRQDCLDPDCPLYPFSYYKGHNKFIEEDKDII